MTGPRPALTVVVVAYGGADQLDRCLRPLAGHHPIVVVDNAGDPATAAVAGAVGARHLASGANLGFAAGVNRALDLLAGTGGHVLLVNPDAVVEPAAVDRMAACLDGPAGARVAAVAPRQHAGPGGEQRVRWPFPTPAGTWADAAGLGRLAPRWSFLAGSVLLLRDAALADVGRFDERFFLYAEEADWQWRARQRGWTVRLCEEAVAYHAGGGTSTDPAVREALFHASAEALLRKWYGPAGWASARAATVVGALARAAWRRGDDRRAALDRARLYLRGPARAAAALVPR